MSKRLSNFDKAMKLQDAYHYALMSCGGQCDGVESTYASWKKPTASEKKNWAAKARKNLRQCGIRVGRDAIGEYLVEVCNEEAARLGYDAYTGHPFEYRKR